MTRSLFLASLLFILCILTVVISSLILSSTLSSIEHDIASSNTLYEYQIVEKKFISKQLFFSLFIKDSTISEIHYTIKELIVFTEHGSADEAAGAKSRLCCMIEQQRRLSRFSISAVF